MDGEEPRFKRLEERLLDREMSVLAGQKARFNAY